MPEHTSENKPFARLARLASAMWIKSCDHASECARSNSEADFKTASFRLDFLNACYTSYEATRREARRQQLQQFVRFLGAV